MTRSRALRALALACLLAAPAAAAEPSPDLIRAHMAFLASDALQGRSAGTPGYDAAADYVAGQFSALGLKPAGDAGTYMQAVPLVSYNAAAEGTLTLTSARARRTALRFGEDYFPAANPLATETTVDAPMVFVGYGIVAPEKGRDDYAGLDVRGKIVVILSGAPAGFQTEERAHYGSGPVKRAQAARRGAVGVLSLTTPERERVRPFAGGRDHWRDPAMTWRGAQGRPHFAGGEAAPLGTLSVAGATKLFRGAPHSFAAVTTAAALPSGAPPRFVLPGRLSARLRSQTADVRSANVAGLIEGSDPTLKAETIVMTAHLDHVGVGTAVNGDAVYNGAMDNAAGVATLLEVARSFVEAPVRPKRSILILAVTAEERGLVGADYFARHPTVARAGMVANVNLDMPILTYAFEDVVAFGADRSTMGPAIARAAARVGVRLSPDPVPEQGLFTRSDHYRFVEQGVPSVFLVTGFGGRGATEFPAFLATHYHKPSDDLSLPIDYVAGARFARVNYEIARELADAAERPRWKAGDFFGRTFGSVAASAGVGGQ